MGGEPYEFNKLQRTDSIRTICDQYREYQNKYKDLATQDESANVKDQFANLPKPVVKFTPGRDTVRAFAKYVTERTRSKACLSTYYVRFIEAFGLYARLISQCKKDQEDALILFDQQYECPEKQRFIRTKLVRLHSYHDKKKEYHAILNLAKYDLTHHLQLKHEGCHGVGLHCILSQ